MPYLGKIIFRASDWTAASAKKNPSMVLFKKHNGKFDASGIYASDTIYDIKIVN